MWPKRDCVIDASWTWPWYICEPRSARICASVNCRPYLRQRRTTHTTLSGTREKLLQNIFMVNSSVIMYLELIFALKKVSD